MTARWNQKVGGDDVVYHLGDLTLQGTARAILSRLNGRIKVIPGSHDRRWLPRGELWSRSGHPVEILPPLVTLTLSKQVIVLCHYAMRVWDKSHYNSIHLYGHSHGRLPAYRNSLDVGVDSHEFAPISLDEVNKFISEGNDESKN